MVIIFGIFNFNNFYESLVAGFLLDYTFGLPSEAYAIKPTFLVVFLIILIFSFLFKKIVRIYG